MKKDRNHKPKWFNEFSLLIKIRIRGVKSVPLCILLIILYVLRCILKDLKAEITKPTYNYHYT